MARHAKKSETGGKVDVDMARPVQDNAGAVSSRHKAVKAPRSALDMGLHPSSKNSSHLRTAVGHPGKSASADAQQATSLPGKMGIIDPHGAASGKDRVKEGIPGIISTTTQGEATRARLVGGIIESPMSSGKAPSGPVHSVSGHDATAYNAGFVHIRGSPFTSRH